MPKEPRANRNIRLTDAEWETFKHLLGAEWLRAKIAQAMTKKTAKANPAK